MKDKLKTIFILYFILTYTVIRGQRGLFELTIKIDNKALSKSINDSVLSSIKNQTAISFETSDFYVPANPAETIKRINENILTKKEIISLKDVVEWDTQKNEAIILGYAPTYSVATKPFFYIAGNFNQIFNEQCYRAIKSNVYNSFLKTVNNFNIKPTNNVSTLRQVNVKDFDCIYHVEFKYLPELLFRQFLNGNLILYEDYELLNVITHSKELIPNQKNIKSLVLYEQWTDTTISNKDLHPNPLPFNTDYIIKKTISIGFTLPNKKTVWLDYEAYKAILTKSELTSDNYKFTIYDLYFQSSFCRQMKMNMIVK